jgi:hypothetical protein
MARDKTDKSDKTAITIRATFPKRRAQGGPLTWKREIVAQDEISRETRTFAEIETGEQAMEAARLTQGNDFWSFLEQLAEDCDAVLRENNLPGATQGVRHDGAGAWWFHPPDGPKLPQKGEIWRFTCGAELAKARADFSDVWFAGRIGLQCRLALANEAQGNAGASFLFQMVWEIAKLDSDWKWRRANKPAILTGRKQRKALGVLRETRNKAAKGAAARRRQRVAEMMQETRLTGGALDAWLARQLAERHGIEASPRTIRADRAAIRG